MFRASFRKVRGFPGVSDGKESTCNAGEHGSIPGLGRSSGEGSGYPLQCSCLDRSLAGYSPWGHKESYAADPLTVSLFFFHSRFHLFEGVKHWRWPWRGVCVCVWFCLLTSGCQVYSFTTTAPCMLADPFGTRVKY